MLVNIIEDNEIDFFEIDCDELDFPNLTTTIEDLPNEILDKIKTYKDKLEENDIITECADYAIDRGLQVEIASLEHDILNLPLNKRTFSMNPHHENTVRRLVELFHYDIPLITIIDEESKYFSDSMNLWNKLLPKLVREDMNTHPCLEDRNITDINSQRKFMIEFYSDKANKRWSNMLHWEFITRWETANFHTDRNVENIVNHVHNSFKSRLVHTGNFKTERQWFSNQDIPEKSHVRWCHKKQQQCIYTFEDKYFTWLETELRKQVDY